MKKIMIAVALLAVAGLAAYLYGSRSSSLEEALNATKSAASTATVATPWVGAPEEFKWPPAQVATLAKVWAGRQEAEERHKIEQYNKEVEPLLQFRNKVFLQACQEIGFKTEADINANCKFFDGIDPATGKYAPHVYRLTKRAEPVPVEQSSAQSLNSKAAR